MGLETLVDLKPIAPTAPNVAFLGPDLERV